MNRMKMPTKLIVAALLMATTVAVSGCGGDQNPTETAPESADIGTSTETVTEAVTESLAEVNVSIAVKDQRGNPVADATLIITDSTGTAEGKTVKTDGDGHTTALLTVGEYRVSFDTLPEYHLAGATSLTVTEGMEAVTLEVTNNTPDGSEEHPFFISENESTFPFSENEALTFTLFAGNRRSVVIQNPNVAVTLGETTYTPDETGTIRVPLVAENVKDHIRFTVKSTVAQDVTVTIYSEPGSLDNPIAVEAGVDIAVIVPKDTVMYYTYTAARNGALILTTADAINNISLSNRNTSQVTDFSNGSTEPLTIGINTGDVVVIAVSVTEGGQTQEAQTVTFKLMEEIQ